MTDIKLERLQFWAEKERNAERALEYARSQIAQIIGEIALEGRKHLSLVTEASDDPA